MIEPSRGNLHEEPNGIWTKTMMHQRMRELSVVLAPLFWTHLSKEDPAVMYGDYCLNGIPRNLAAWLPLGV